jgi:hypothetical protein
MHVCTQRQIAVVHGVVEPFDTCFCKKRGGQVKKNTPIKKKTVSLPYEYKQ